MSNQTQRCTGCGRESVALKTRSWSAEHGDLIKPGEALCTVCSSARGCKTLKEIERDLQRDAVR